jgi:hypothetical protein
MDPAAAPTLSDEADWAETVAKVNAYAAAKVAYYNATRRSANNQAPCVAGLLRPC